MPDESTLMEFAAHLDGRNATVRIYPDRLEWQRSGSLTKKLMTGGLGGRSRDTEVIPARAITGVTSHKHGFGYTDVRILMAGRTVELGKLPKDRAVEVQRLLVQLVGQ